MGSNGVPLERLFNLDQWDVNFWKINNIFWLLPSKQYTKTHSLISEDFTLESSILGVWCVEDVMIHYNNDNNAYCSAVNAKKFETRKHNAVWISTFLQTTNLYSYSHLQIFIWLYSVRGEIYRISTNTLIYTMCCALKVYVCLHIDWSPYYTFKNSVWKKTIKNCGHTYFIFYWCTLA